MVRFVMRVLYVSNKIYLVAIAWLSLKRFVCFFVSPIGGSAVREPVNQKSQQPHRSGNQPEHGDLYARTISAPVFSDKRFRFDHSRHAEQNVDHCGGNNDNVKYASVVFH